MQRRKHPARGGLNDLLRAGMLVGIIWPVYYSGCRGLLREVEGDGHFAHLLVAHAFGLKAHVLGGDVDEG